MYGVATSFLLRYFLSFGGPFWRNMINNFTNYQIGGRCTESLCDPNKVWGPILLEIAKNPNGSSDLVKEGGFRRLMFKLINPQYKNSRKMGRRVYISNNY